MRGSRTFAWGISSLAALVAAAAGAVTVGALPAPASPGVPPTVDPIAVLDRQIAAGEITLSADDANGYLRALLGALDIPISSQGLVFSRTSLQTDRISPWAPRALYFNDDVYVGWVKGSPVLEIASIDPTEGAVFYTVAQDGGDRPVFQRQTTTCLMCHASRAVTGGIHGLIMMSVLTDRHGYVVTPVHEGSTTGRTPYAERWGGWYVTGTDGGRHSGNVMSPLLSHEVSDAARYLSEFDMHTGGNVTSLDGRFNTDPYLTGYSDIVALLVLSHQTRVHNTIIMARDSAEEAMRDQSARLSHGSVELPASGLLPGTEARIDAAVDRLVRELLLSGEAPLPGRVQGTSGFAQDFTRRGPHDSKGRSLRALDLESRLFRYPLSFLIYSDSFDALQDFVKERVYRRLDSVLRGEDVSGDFDHLTDADRRAILEILEETKPEFVARRTPPR